MAVPLMVLATGLQATTATYGEATTLPPAEAGNRVLAGERHGPIVAVEREASMGPVPPGSARLFLVERPRRVPGGCTRRKWMVDFSARDGGRVDGAVVAQRRVSWEAGLARRGSCGTARFVGYSGVDRVRALALLAALADWRARPGTVRLTCGGDRVLAAICASPAATRRALMAATPWHVPKDLTLWALVDGRRGYTITFDALPPTTLGIDGRVPAPF